MRTQSPSNRVVKLDPAHGSNVSACLSGCTMDKNYNVSYFTLKLAYLYLHFDIQCFTTYFYPCLTRGENCLFLIIRFRQIKIEIIHTHLPYLLLKFLFPFISA